MASEPIKARQNLTTVLERIDPVTASSSPPNVLGAFRGQHDARRPDVERRGESFPRLVMKTASPWF